MRWKLLSFLLPTTLVTMLSSSASAASSCDQYGLQVTTTAVPSQSSTGLKRAAEVAQNIPQQANVALIGDSIAQQYPADLLRSLAGQGSAVNLGVGGDKVQNVLWRLKDPAYGRLRAQRVLIILGTNNLTDPACAIYAGYQTVVNEIRSQWAPRDIAIVGVLPRYDAYAERVEEHRKELNEQLRKMPGTRFVDVSSALTCNSIDCTDYQKDRLHLTRSGYEKISASIASQLR